LIRYLIYFKDLSIATKGILILTIPFITLLITIYFLYARDLASQKVEDSLLFETDHIVKIESIKTLLTKASAGMGSYLLTGNIDFLGAYHQAKTKVPINLKDLDQNVTDSNFKQQLYSLKNLVREIFSLWDSVIKNHNMMSKATLTDQLVHNKKLKNKIYDQISLMHQLQATLIQQQNEHLIHLRQANLKKTIFAALFCIFTAFIAIRLYFIDIVKRIKTLRNSAALLTTSPFAIPNIQQPKDEISELNESLLKSASLLALRQQQTDQARAEAELANSAKTMFLSRTSHDLRTPLNAIIGYAQILHDALPAGNLREKTTFILSSGNHLLKMINDLLNASRTNTGHINLELAQYALKPIVFEATTILDQRAKNKGLHFAIAVDDNTEVFADKGKLLQILLNLISNAIKYGPSDATITIWSETTLTHTLINVKDEGKGIDAHLRHRLFTPYDRLGAENSAVEGAGLGLSSAKELAIAMNGTISIADHSSIFSLHLPKQPIQLNETIVDKTHSELSEPSDVKYILFVNDNADNIMFIETAIRRQKQIHLHRELCTNHNK
jgi:signal transduction histidine kinase